MKSKSLKIRISAEDKAALIALAKDCGISLSSWCLMILKREITKGK